MWKEYTKSLKFPESYISMGLGFLVVVVAGLLIFNFVNRGKTTQAPQRGEIETSQPGPEVAPAFPIPTVHKVAVGENLWSIAEKYYRSGYNWVTIANENKLADPDTIEVGQELNIPSSQTITVGGEISATSTSRITSDSYTVKEGDYLWDIAVRAYGDGYSWVKIAQANKLVHPDTIHTGNVLKIQR